jgi:hypothetical protein
MHRVYPYIVAPNGVVVCNVKSSMNRPQARVDARLIAAAPDLLAALRGLLAMLDGEAPLNTHDAYEAVAKATGEQP